MNPSVWTALQPILAQGARDVLRIVGTYLAAHGLIVNGSAGVETFIGAGMALAGLFWGWWTTSGYLQVAGLLKKLTNTSVPADAVKAAKALPPAAAVDTSLKSNAVANAVAKVLIVAFALSLFLAGGQALAQRRPAITGDIVKDIKTDLANKGVSIPTVKAGDACSVNIFAALDAKNVITTIQNCISEANSPFLPDLQAALDSATAYKDQPGIACLTPALAIVKAAVGTPGDPNATPPVPATRPGVILIFQKFREFVLAGGPAACKTYINSTVAGAVPL